MSVCLHACVLIKFQHDELITSYCQQGNLTSPPCTPSPASPMMSPASAMSYGTPASANLPSTLDDSGGVGVVTGDDRPLNLSTGSRRTRSPPRSPLSPTAAFIYAEASSQAAGFREPTTVDPYLHYPHHPFPLNGQSAVELLQQVARKTQQRQAESKGRFDHRLTWTTYLQIFFANSRLL